MQEMGVRGWVGGQGGCEPRIEVIVKMKQKVGRVPVGGGGGGRRSGWR